MRAHRKPVNFIPGQNGIMVSAQFEDVNINELVKNWLEYVRTKENLSISKTTFATLVQKYPIEDFIKKEA